MTDLSTLDIAAIEAFYQGSGHAYKVYNDFLKSEVGDVYIRKYRSTGKTENVSMALRLPKKFEVVAIDGYGNRWLKQVKIGGGLGKAIHTPVQMCASMDYEIDPELAESYILGVEYDSREQYRKWKKSNKKQQDMG